MVTFRHGNAVGMSFFSQRSARSRNKCQNVEKFLQPEEDAIESDSRDFYGYSADADPRASAERSEKSEKSENSGEKSERINQRFDVRDRFERKKYERADATRCEPKEADAAVQAKEETKHDQRIQRQKDQNTTPTTPWRPLVPPVAPTTFHADRDHRDHLGEPGKAKTNGAVSDLKDIIDATDNPIGLLQNLVARHLCRPVVEGDVEYAFEQLDSGSFVASVSVAALERPIAGYPELKKASAKKSAAREALVYFEHFQDLEKVLAIPKPKTGKAGVQFLDEVQEMERKEPNNKIQSIQSVHRVVSNEDRDKQNQRSLYKSHSTGRVGHVGHVGHLGHPIGHSAVLKVKGASGEARGFLEPEGDAKGKRQTASRSEKKAKVSKAQAKIFQKLGVSVANPVGVLNEKIAAIVRRQVTQDDISYSFETVGERFMCTVSVDLESLGIGQEVLQASSEPVANKREAKILAADALLSSDVSDFQLPRNQQTHDLEPVEPVEDVEPEAMSLLYEIVQLLLRRDPTEDDIIYTVEELEEGFVATVQIPIMQRLPACEGEVAATRTEAKTLAAEAALLSIREA